MKSTFFRKGAKVNICVDVRSRTLSHGSKQSEIGQSIVYVNKIVTGQGKYHNQFFFRFLKLRLRRLLYKEYVNSNTDTIIRAAIAVFATSLKTPGIISLHKEPQ